jgi:hypothetical protein
LKDDWLRREKCEERASPNGAQGFHQSPVLMVEAGSNSREVSHDFETIGIGEAQRDLEDFLRVLIEIIHNHDLMLPKANVLN